MLTYLYYSTYAYAKIAAIRALVARMQWGVLAERHHLSGQGQGFAGRFDHDAERWNRCRAPLPLRELYSRHKAAAAAAALPSLAALS